MIAPLPADGPETVGTPRVPSHGLQPLRTATTEPAKSDRTPLPRDSTVFSPLTRALAKGSCRLIVGSLRVLSRSIGAAGGEGRGGGEGDDGVEGGGSGGGGGGGEVDGGGGGGDVVEGGGGGCGGGGGGGGGGGDEGGDWDGDGRDEGGVGRVGSRRAKMQRRVERRWCAAACAIWASI